MELNDFLPGTRRQRRVVASLAGIATLGIGIFRVIQGRFPWEDSDADKANKLHQEGVASFMAGDHAQAERSLREALRGGHVANLGDLWIRDVSYSLGLALLRLQRHSEAAEQLLLSAGVKSVADLSPMSAMNGSTSSANSSGAYRENGNADICVSDEVTFDVVDGKLQIAERVTAVGHALMAGKDHSSATQAYAWALATMDVILADSAQCGVLERAAEENPFFFNVQQQQSSASGGDERVSPVAQLRGHRDQVSRFLDEAKRSASAVNSPSLSRLNLSRDASDLPSPRGVHPSGSDSGHSSGNGNNSNSGEERRPAGPYAHMNGRAHAGSDSEAEGGDSTDSEQVHEEAWQDAAAGVGGSTDSV